MALHYEHESLKYELLFDGRIALVTLNRPKQLNAFTGPMGVALTSAYERAAADPIVRVIVLTGAGRGFCAGADMGGLQATGGGNVAAVQGAPAQPLPTLPEDFILTPTRISKPVVCAINGSCAGIGLSIAMACDVRFAAAGSKLTAAFPKRGLIAEHGMSWAVPHLVGTGNAMMLILSGDIFSAEDCQQMGMIQRVFPKETLLDQSLEFAKRLAQNTPAASAAVIKQQVWHHPRMTREEALAESNLLMRATASPKNPDFKEGVNSFVEKRVPRFGGYDSTRPVIDLAKTFFGPKGAKL